MVNNPAGVPDGLAALAPVRDRVGPGRQIRGAESPRKVLQVLLQFTQSRPHATISELAEEIGVPLSTCYRYVRLLREIGLLEEGERSTYHVTPQIMHVARAAQVANNLARVARPYLERVAEQVDETVMLIQAYGPSAVCVESIESRRPVRLSFEAGHTMPLGDGASAKLLLACMGPTEWTARLDERAATEPSFATRRRALEQELPQIAERGWATSLAEVEEGVWACSAAIRDGARTVGVISVAGPAFRIDEQSRQRMVGLVLEATAELGAAITSRGGR
jgi:DNA-binding IclR family transcriptional regulator